MHIIYYIYIYIHACSGTSEYIGYNITLNSCFVLCIHAVSWGCTLLEVQNVLYSYNIIIGKTIFAWGLDLWPL